MRERTRFVLMAVAGALALLSAASLIALRAGRPLYYSDGEQTHFGGGRDLRDAPMLLWGRPEPEAELIGTVRGRVATLPDGSVMYGRAVDEGRTELVRAARAGADPVPIGALASSGHDLAPALAPDGRTVYFASDRAHEGGGGYDLWQAQLDGGGFGPPRVLPAPIATPGDETDPALDPRTGELVFARRGEGETWFRLWSVPLDGSREPTLLFAESVSPERASEREPAFAPDGTTLWFVRRAGDGPVELVQAFRHVGRFADPFQVPALNRAGVLRAPEVLDDGRSLRLLDAGKSLVYRARAHEVYPWWEGQAALEQILLVILLVSLLLLLLLILGRRWRALDVVTWCLIASLLLHLAILLWLRGVEIVRRYRAPDPRPGQMEITLVPAGTQLAASAAASGALVADVQFASQSEALAVEAPAASAPMVERDAPHAASGEREAAAVLASVAAPERAVQDTPATETARAARATTVVLAATHAAEPAPQSAPVEVARAATADTVNVVVELPGAASGALASVATPGAPAGTRAAALPVLAGITPARTVPSDAASGAEARVATAGSGPATSAVDVDLAPRAPSSVAARVAPAAEAGEPAAAGAPGSSLAVVHATAAIEGRAAEGIPHARELSPSPVRLADAPASTFARAPTSASASISPPPPLVAAATPAVTPRDAAPVEARAPSRPVGADPLATLPAPSALAPVPTSAAPAGMRTTATPARSFALPLPRLADAPAAHGSAVVPPAVAAAVPPAPAEPLRGAEPEPASPMADLERRAPAAAAGGESTVLPASALAAAPGAPAPRGAHAGTPPSARSMTLHGPRLADGESASVAGATAGPAPQSSEAATLRALAGAPIAVAVPDLLRPTRSTAGEAGRHRVAAGLELPPSALPIAPTEWTAAAGVAARAVPEFYRNRFGPQKAEAIEAFGGSQETEAAVRRGLAYLARIQQADGGWGRRRRMHEKYGEVEVGKSALCLLALLGAGHTPGSAAEHAGNADAAVRWLLAQQDSQTGHFGVTSSYSHGITTYALAECYAMTRDERLRAPLEQAVAWITKNQNRTRDRRNFGGWPYFSSSLRAEDRFARTSVTAWMVMALESARMSGLTVQEGVIEDARTFLWGMFDAEHGSFLYNKEPSRMASDWRTLPGSTPGAVFCLLLTGADRDDPRLRSALAWILERAPGPYRRYRDDDFVLRGAGNVYFWYHGSLACFLAGGEVWPAWNAALKASLLQGQDIDGSFPMIDVYAEYAGDTDRDRAYTTAMCVLSLEAYYRYFTPLVRPR